MKYINDLAVEMFLINKIFIIAFTDQGKKGIKHGQVKLSDFDKKYELHFLKPEQFPVSLPALKFRLQGQKDLEVVQSNLLFLLHYSVSPCLLSHTIGCWIN